MGACLIDARDDELWRGLARHRFGSLFSSPPWIDAVARTYGFKISALACANGSELEAAVLFSYVCDVRGERVVCLPFSDYCDPLVEDTAVWDELITPILDLGVPVALRCFRNDLPASDNRFTLEGRALWHGIDLTRCEDDLWAGLEGSARQNVRKAKRNGVTVRERRDVDAVRLFHSMHCHVRKSKHRLLAQPAAFFENLYEEFAPKDQLTILLAELDDAPIAGIFFLEWGDTLYYKYNASFDQRFCPNDLLVWQGMLLGRRRGLAVLDFGLSKLEHPGLVRYKRKFASEERYIRLLQWQPEVYADPRAEEATRTLDRLTRLLTAPEVPDDITRAAGDELYRFFC
jgi:CelD/BcsL family acetyltransferase involved in cellulose biosynthesis